MNVASLVGETIQSVRIFRREVHPAWIDRDTLPIAAGAAFIDVLCIGLLKITACEVDAGPERYPALGLELQLCSHMDLGFHSADGQTIEAEFLTEISALLPFVIRSIEQSDPLGEDAVNEYALVGSDGQRLIFRHMMPPTTLGIAVNPPAVD
jgi:hypothetical protein